MAGKNVDFLGLGDIPILGALGGSEDVYGKRPEAIAPVTPTDITLDAARANQAALPTLKDIGADINAYNLRERNKALTTVIPGYENLLSAQSGVLDDWLHGRVPEDVQQQVALSSAGRAISSGYGGQMGGGMSGMGLYGAARNFGDTSAKYQQMGMQLAPNFLRTVSAVAAPPQYDVMSGFLTPSYNPYGEYAAQQYNANLAAAPDPGTAGAAAAQMGLIESVLSIYGGGGPKGIPGDKDKGGWGGGGNSSMYDWNRSSSGGGYVPNTSYGDTLNLSPGLSY